MTFSPALALYLALSERWAKLVENTLRNRMNRGKEDPDRMNERRGIAQRERPQGPLIWVHAASVGESLSTLEVIRQIGQVRPEITFMVTTGSRTSAALMGVRLSKNAFHQFVPVDVRPYIRSFLDYWKPDLAIWTESEFWPALMHETGKAGVPMLLLNARMSAASHRKWRWNRGMIKALLANFDRALAQDEDSARHLRQLGMPADRIEVTGFLKEGALVLPHDETQRKQMAALIGTRPVWFAASTHAGEDEIVVAAHKLAQRTTHRLLLILAPRHQDRADGIEKMLLDQGWDVARRSKNQEPNADTQIYLADTMGEMGLWYRLAPTSLVCGSLVTGIGGHNPFEPAALGSAILHGPYPHNFQDIYDRLAEAKAAVQVATPEQIANQVIELLSPDKAATLAHAAWEVSSRGAEVTTRAVEVILDMFDTAKAR